MSNGLSGVMIILILVGVIFGAGYLTAMNDGKTSNTICEAALRQSVSTNVTAVPQATQAVALAATVDQLKQRVAIVEQENTDLALRNAVQATRIASFADTTIPMTGEETSTTWDPQYTILIGLLGLAIFGVGGITGTLWAGHARRNETAASRAAETNVYATEGLNVVTVRMNRAEARRYVREQARRNNR